MSDWPPFEPAAYRPAPSSRATATPARRPRPAERSAGECASWQETWSLSPSLTSGLLRVLGFLHIHLERGASDDAQHQRRKSVVGCGGVPYQGPHQRHILIFDAAAQRVC